MKTQTHWRNNMWKLLFADNKKDLFDQAEKLGVRVVLSYRRSPGDYELEVII